MAVVERCMMQVRSRGRGLRNGAIHFANTAIPVVRHVVHQEHSNIHNAT